MSIGSAIARVAIIGTAGRKEDADKMTLELYDEMYRVCVDLIENTFKLKYSSVHLVSGGAAWSDHLAVRLYLDNLLDEKQDAFNGLTVYLPCPIVLAKEKTMALDTGQYDWKTNPGKKMNQLHQKFGQCIGRNTMLDLYCVVQFAGGTLDTSCTGFHQRNQLVAACD